MTAPISNSPGRILVVDNDVKLRTMLSLMLTGHGYEVSQTDNGEEALQRVREFKPHWITMDVNLPGLNGFQATEALRAEHPSARIIIVTSYNEAHYRQLSRTAGAVAVISKDNLMALRIMLARDLAGPAGPPPAATGNPPA